MDLVITYMRKGLSSLYIKNTQLSCNQMLCDTLSINISIIFIANKFLVLVKINSINYFVNRKSLFDL